MSDTIKLAFIGGSGLYKIDDLKDIQEKDISTPFGKPSDKIIIGTINNTKCAFLPRHGKNHTIAPNEINQRANMYALKSIGVERIVSINSCGSLKEEIKAKDFVIPEQIYDKTKNRINSYFGEGIVAHISFAQPFCQNLRKVIKNCLEKLEIIHHYGGTYVCIEGPQFSTKIESEIHKQMGFDIVGMTVAQEAKLAREAEMCYANISLITDYDAWKQGSEVSNDVVLSVAKANLEQSRRVIKELINDISKMNSKCACHSALQNSFMADKEIIKASPKYKSLALFLDKYFKD